MKEEISTIEVKSKVLKEKLEFVNDPKFVEKKIREQFDSGDGDLVFIFSDSSYDSTYELGPEAESELESNLD